MIQQRQRFEVSSLSLTDVFLFYRYGYSQLIVARLSHLYKLSPYAAKEGMTGEATGNVSQWPSNCTRHHSPTTDLLIN